MDCWSSKTNGPESVPRYANSTTSTSATPQPIAKTRSRVGRGGGAGTRAGFTSRHWTHGRSRVKPKNFFLRRLLRPQCHQWINLRGAAGGEPAGERGDGDEQQTRAGERHGIGGWDVEEQARDEPRERER